MQAGADGQPRYVAGVNSGPHDPSAALLRDGELVAMVEQERLSRRKHAMLESPADALTACLEEAGIGIADVAEIAVGWDVPRLRELEGGAPFSEEELFARLTDGAGNGEPRLPPLRYVDHHLAHAASAFYTSGMDEAAILVLDGAGEVAATTLARGGPGGIEVLRSWGRNRSLGHLYGCAADWAGLGYWGAGKLMGLASYGTPNQPVPLETTESGYAIPGAPTECFPIMPFLQEFRDRLQTGFCQRNYPYGAGTGDVMAHADFAASIQRALEQVVLRLAAIARRETGCAGIVLAGGVALNCTANGVLIRSGTFDEVWIPPVPHDAGVSLGAALYADREMRDVRSAPPRLPHAFWAPERGGTAEQAADSLTGCDIDRHVGDGLADAVAARIADGQLVGWWQGRAEVGQRALGARSVLCDPRRRSALVHANRVKGREPWRPLAPAVLAEHANALFDGPLPAISELMLAAWPVRAAARARIPAAVHVDGTARPQLVGATPASYRRTIEAFHDRTGVPAIVNTSFNLAGEPVVLSAEDAVRAFLRSDLDVLVLGDLIAVKPNPHTHTPERGPDIPGWPFSGGE